MDHGAGDFEIAEVGIAALGRHLAHPGEGGRHQVVQAFAHQLVPLFGVAEYRRVVFALGVALAAGAFVHLGARALGREGGQGEAGEKQDDRTHRFP